MTSSHVSAWYVDVPKLNIKILMDQNKVFKGKGKRMMVKCYRHRQLYIAASQLFQVTGIVCATVCMWEA